MSEQIVLKCANTMNCSPTILTNNLDKSQQQNNALYKSQQFEQWDTFYKKKRNVKEWYVHNTHNCVVLFDIIFGEQTYFVFLIYII